MEKISREIATELLRRYWEYEVPTYRNKFEGFLVLAESVTKLREEIFLSTSTETELREKAIRVAVDAIRFIYDICQKENR